MKGSQIMFLRTLNEDVPKRFSECWWVGGVQFAIWAESSSCSWDRGLIQVGTVGGRMHECSYVEFRSICRKYRLSVKGARGDLIERVRVQFQRVYQLYKL